MTSKKRVCEIQAMTVCLHQTNNLAVATPKHSQMKISSNRSADQAQAEFVRINLTIHYNVDACKSTTNDRNQLYCIEYQSLCESHCRTKSYFPKQFPPEHQLLRL